MHNFNLEHAATPDGTSHILIVDILLQYYKYIYNKSKDNFACCLVWL